MNINKLIDHTLLRTDATISDIRQLCKDAIKHDFVSVCVSPIYVPLAVEYLQEHETKVGTTIGFPIGAVSTEMKFTEARFVIHQGAEEIDMVINVATKPNVYGSIAASLAKVNKIVCFGWGLGLSFEKSRNPVRILVKYILSSLYWYAFKVSKIVWFTNENDIDLIIDFSRPQNSIEVLRFACKENIPTVLGTTGFNQTELNEINEITKEIPLLIAPNTSMGMAMFKKVIHYSKDVLKIASSIEIHEKHHKKKKDSPSGTAINLKEQLKEILSTEEIEILSFREGDSPGEHSLKLFFEDETLEISHKVLDRSIFAKGAIIAGKWLKNKPPGPYTMQDIYSS